MKVNFKKYIVDILEYKKRPSKIYMIGFTFWKICFLEYYLTEGCSNQRPFSTIESKINNLRNPPHLLVTPIHTKHWLFFAEHFSVFILKEKKKTQTNIL